MAISTNQKPTIYRDLYENTDPEKWRPCQYEDSRVLINGASRANVAVRILSGSSGETARVISYVGRNYL